MSLKFFTEIIFCRLLSYSDDLHSILHVVLGMRAYLGYFQTSMKELFPKGVTGF